MKIGTVLILCVDWKNIFNSRLLEYFLQKELGRKGIKIISRGLSRSEIDPHFIVETYRLIQDSLFGREYFQDRYRIEETAGQPYPDYSPKKITASDLDGVVLVLAATDRQRKQFEIYFGDALPVKLTTEFLPRRHHLYQQSLSGLCGSECDARGREFIWTARHLIKVYEQLSLLSILKKLGRG